MTQNIQLDRDGFLKIGIGVAVGVQGVEKEVVLGMRSITVDLAMHAMIVRKVPNGSKFAVD